LGTKRRTKRKKYSVRKIVDEQGYSKSTEKWQHADLRNDEVDGHLLAGERIKNLGVVGRSSCWSSWSSRTMPPPGKQSWACRMM